ncbi:hypothetical protein [Streptomyces sp. ISL-100]|uniref:hypothetical protein n=1 Tax=Streptomyces sp. ISL-100 TaxID=2819173 RepID=UPI001BE5A995|nr:hypothetical protein [Streptomyces sp. ISL-100]MBT2395245.1 hypothetical protein [Streptomyces sp. ISL-100]
MATTARTRKTTAKTTAEDDTAAAPDIEPTDSGPTAPEAAPLEPPHVDDAPEPPAAPLYVTPTEVIPDEENLADVILDDATGQPPANLDEVFVPLTPFGSTLQCTVRLIERTFLGPHHSPVTRLLQPKGAVVSENIAARIRERLDAQAARTNPNQ